MPTIRRPRFGSMQYWPRKRASRPYARVRSWVDSKDAKLLAFPGYKVSMVHVMAINENKKSHINNEEMSVPGTIIECPPIRIASSRFYQKINAALVLSKEIFFKTEKELLRKIPANKETKAELDKLNPDDYDKITVTVYTQPKKSGVGKKTPELFESGIGGTNAGKIAFIKEHADKEIPFESVFDVGQFVDLHGITKGKGTQGPVRRFGIGFTSHKSEKGTRTPGSLGPWVRAQHISWRVAHAGQTGFHQRTEHNKQILDVSEELDKYGKDFERYGNLKTKYILLHGSVMGPKRRTIIMTKPIREKEKKHKLAIQ